MQSDKNSAAVEASYRKIDRLIFAIQHDSDQAFNRLRVEVLINQAFLEHAAKDESAARIEQQTAEIADLQCQLAVLRAEAQKHAVRLLDTSEVNDAEHVGTHAHFHPMCRKLKNMMGDAKYHVGHRFSGRQLNLAIAKMSHSVLGLHDVLGAVCAQVKGIVQSWGSRENTPSIRPRDLATDIDAARAIAAQHTCCSKRRAPCSFECACYFEAKARREGSTTPTTSADSASS